MISLFVTACPLSPARLTKTSGFVNVLIQFPQKPVLPNVKTSVLNLVQETASLIMKLAEQVNAQAIRHVTAGLAKAICQELVFIAVMIQEVIVVTIRIVKVVILMATVVMSVLIIGHRAVLRFLRIVIPAAAL